jgi:hypothetical protein
MMKSMRSTFSVELYKGKNISRILVDSNKESLIEGSLGMILEVSIHDGVLLEVKGSDGVLRVDLPVALIEAALKGDKR